MTPIGFLVYMIGFISFFGVLIYWSGRSAVRDMESLDEGWDRIMTKISNLNHRAPTTLADFLRRPEE